MMREPIARRRTWAAHEQKVQWVNWVSSAANNRAAVVDGINCRAVDAAGRHPYPVQAAFLD